MPASEGEKTGTADVYRAIQQYCHDRTDGIGGSYSQEPYKADFFKIFMYAYRKHLCGRAARDRYKKRRSNLKKKRISLADFDVSGHSIERYLRQRWLAGRSMSRDDDRMISDLCNWWDEWVYAWDLFPEKLPKNWKFVTGHQVESDKFLISDVFSSDDRAVIGASVAQDGDC